MKIVIKAKDFTKFNIDEYAVFVLPTNDESSDGSTEAIARAVAWAFLNDVAEGKYSNYVQAVKKPDGSVDEDKKTVVKKETNGFMFQGAVGVLRNKKFNPLERHSDDVREYLTSSNMWEQSYGQEGQGIYGPFEGEFDVTLQIGSRFDSEKRQYFLESMFVDEPFEFKDNENDIPPDDKSILDFLVLILFRQQLRDAYENGPYRKYVKYERNDSRLRGSIDIARHIKMNAGLNNGKVAYSYRENTPDNNITHLIIHAYEHTLKYFPEYAYSLFFSGDNPIVNIITELKTMAPSYADTNARMVVAKSDRVVDHPYYYKYEALRKTCIMLLRFDGLSLFDGSDEDVQGILFYIPTLWENFLEREFKRRLNEPFGRQMEAQYRSDVYVVANEKEGKATFPDYVFFYDEDKKKPLMILDAKFKPEWAKKFNLGSATLPYLEDFTKCVRDMSALKARCTGVVFPDKTDDDIEPYREYMVSVRNQSEFYTIPVKVPDSSDDRYQGYHEWLTNFNSNIELAATTLSGLLEYHKDNIDKTNQLYQRIAEEVDLSAGDVKILTDLFCIDKE